MNTKQLRQHFVDYFASKDHVKLPSSSLVPINDPTLLFANAGMNQFKDYFTGKANAENKRAVTIQKVVRAGGKHNDLENVGFTARHHTFFEMMGNFSFGDYFKSEAIHFAWEFLTQVLKIDKDRLLVSVHHSDKEAADIWHNQEGVPKERIFYRGDKDNFWEMGDVGPCGPCSEIYYDHGAGHTDPQVDTSECLLDDENRYVEIWNLVFMQYEKFIDDKGEIQRRPLPKPSVDTGAGLERVAAVIQGKYNNFDTDVFAGIMQAIEKVTGLKYSDHQNSFRVVADHIRSTTMLLTDGVIPSNEGRGYVLRRIIRRATRHLEEMGVHDTTLFKLVTAVFDSLGEEYPDNLNNQALAEKYLKLEEESFRKTLATGLELLKKSVNKLKKANKKQLSGEDVFKLYDTYGFPVDLTQTILEEQGLEVDEAGFEKHMQEQRERSKKAGQFSVKSDNLKEFYAVKEKHGETEFLGYSHLQATAKLIETLHIDGNTYLIFDKTPFYGESGGQAGDRGWIQKSGKEVAQVIDTQKPVDGLHVHIVEGELSLAQGAYDLVVDAKSRNLSARNHTATHLLQAALIQVLGDHVKQAGSYVGADRLRFDFTHPESMDKEQVKKVEKLVNAEIRKDILLTADYMSKDEATAKGAMALFGEKYGDTVRVVSVPGFSVELCGGTHVKSTGDIGYFVISSESSLQAGVRRIEALTSDGAFEYVTEKLGILEQIESEFKAKGEQLVKRAQQVIEENSVKQKEIKSLKDKLQTQASGDLFDGLEELSSGVKYKAVAAPEGSDLRKLGDLFIDKNPNGVLLIHLNNGDKASVLLKTSRKNSAVNCSDILKNVLAEFGGRGGGKPDMAQGAVDSTHLADVESRVKQELS